MSYFKSHNSIFDCHGSRKKIEKQYRLTIHYHYGSLPTKTSYKQWVYFRV